MGTGRADEEERGTNALGEVIRDDVAKDCAVVKRAVCLVLVSAAENEAGVG